MNEKSLVGLESREANRRKSLLSENASAFHVIDINPYAIVVELSLGVPIFRLTIWLVLDQAFLFQK
jgi:hypothetical protein